MLTSLKWPFSWPWASLSSGKTAGAGILSVSERILGGYPRGYITEPQQSSFCPSNAHGSTPTIPEVYCWSAPDLSPIHPWVYSWTYPRAYRLTYPRGLSPDPVRFQLLPLWPWRGHTPECGDSRP